MLQTVRILRSMRGVVSSIILRTKHPSVAKVLLGFFELAGAGYISGACPQKLLASAFAWSLNIVVLPLPVDFEMALGCDFDGAQLPARNMMVELTNIANVSITHHELRQSNNGIIKRRVPASQTALTITCLLRSSMNYTDEISFFYGQCLVADQF